MLAIVILMDWVICVLVCMAKAVIKRLFKFRIEDSAFKSRYFFSHLHPRDFETYTSPVYNLNWTAHPTTLFAD
jgi:hypothetical protein